MGQLLKRPIPGVPIGDHWIAPLWRCGLHRRRRLQQVGDQAAEQPAIEMRSFLHVQMREVRQIGGAALGEH